MDGRLTIAISRFALLASRGIDLKIHSGNNDKTLLGQIFETLYFNVLYLVLL